ncbi:hypothetical protein [Deminuibacter soli]|nr:hypothetical protein [Deminuibacter soli]
MEQANNMMAGIPGAWEGGRHGKGMCRLGLLTPAAVTHQQEVQKWRTIQ